MTHSAFDAAPRHARMFELLRQSSQADMTHTRLTDTDPFEPASLQDIQTLRDKAIRSLRPSPIPPQG